MGVGPGHFDTETLEDLYEPVHFFNARNVVKSGFSTINKRGGKEVHSAIFGSVSANVTGEFASSFYLEVVSLVLPVFHCPYNISYGAYLRFRTMNYLYSCMPTELIPVYKQGGHQEEDY